MQELLIVESLITFSDGWVDYRGFPLICAIWKLKFGLTIFFFSGYCSHARSYKYYAESLTSGGFQSKSCSGIVSYNLGNCRNSETAVMGNDAIDRRWENSFDKKVKIIWDNSEYKLQN